MQRVAFLSKTASMITTINNTGEQHSHFEACNIILCSTKKKKNKVHLLGYQHMYKLTIRSFTSEWHLQNPT